MFFCLRLCASVGASVRVRGGGDGDVCVCVCVCARARVEGVEVSGSVCGGGGVCL